MSLPLPTSIWNQPGGPVGEYNSLRQGLYNNQIKKAQAQYAPYTTYADAQSKLAYSKMLPYQIQATVMSNPMFWMAYQKNPDALKKIMENFTKTIPQGQNVVDSTELPKPGQMNTGNSLLKMVLDKIGTGNQSNQNAMQSGMGDQNNNNSLTNPLSNLPSQSSIPQSSGSALAPGGLEGITAKNTAPYTQSPYEQGKTIAGDNGAISVPTSGTVQSAQTAIQGIKNLKPIFERISKGAERWLSPGMKGKVSAARLANLAEQYGGNLLGIPETVLKATGITKKDITDYADWKADQQKAVETYMKARGWPQDEIALKKVSGIIEPIAGEGKEYGNRVARDLKQLENELLPNYQQALSSGFNLGENSSTSQSPSAGAKILGNKLDLPNFSSKEEFQTWYGKQSKMVQDAVKLHLSKKSGKS